MDRGPSSDFWPGSPAPLGATYDDGGTNFALFSEVADKVEVCLFDGTGVEERIALPERDASVWHVYLPGIGPGQRYGFRIYGPYDPVAGLRCNPAKLLLDPYAKAVDGSLKWNDSVFGEQPGGRGRNDADSAMSVPKSVVINPFFDWGTVSPPRREWHETVLYEAHVRGLTIRHPAVPERLRGTYAGLAHSAVLEHLRELGVTAVQLMPVQHFITARELLRSGLSDYWGYDDPIASFAPHQAYALAQHPGEQVPEFKAMVRSLHEAGIEVILDVVLTHTGERSHLGPTLSLRGIDNPAYYRLREDGLYYSHSTGTSNERNWRHFRTLQLIMDCLRYWVTEMRVDGFCFPLANNVARQLFDTEQLSTFLTAVLQDPVLGQVKLLGERIGADGYQEATFPTLWAELNDMYCATVRDYWRGQPTRLNELASQLTGSPDRYGIDRRPAVSINFVTLHDGLTLTDLVSYNDKHNEANGELGRDGTNYNRSWNCGIEGLTDDQTVLGLRARQRRNLLATLFLSQGVPLLSHGDEVGHTQWGNNHAWCQDNELTWVDWSAADDDFLSFVRQISALRRDHRVFRRRWCTPFVPAGDSLAVPDIAFLDRHADPIDPDSVAGPLLVFLNGRPREHGVWTGGVVTDDDMIVILNPLPEPTYMRLPDARFGDSWIVLLDTAQDSEAALREDQRALHGEELALKPHSLVVLASVSRNF